MKKFDIGIYGLWYGHNYGSIMTYYALSRALQSRGYSCAMIDNPLNTDLEIDSLRRSHPLRFAKDHYDIAPFYRLNEMNRLNEMFDSFLIGSDQMWNYSLSAPYQQSYFLDFVNDDKRKFSYAVSFGKDSYDGPADEIERIKKNLARFTDISVRDDFSKDILSRTFGIDSNVVADPVFLCSVEDYNELIKEIRDFQISGEYIFAYILDPNIVIGDNLSRIADEMNIKIVVCFNESGDKTKFKEELGLHSENVICMDDPTAQEWLYLFKNSKFVLTDSYHGACFSIIFNKPFIVKKNIRRGGKRFDHLLKMFDLKDNMIDNPSMFFGKINSMGLDHSTNYDSLGDKIINYSKQWLERI